MKSSLCLAAIALCVGACMAQVGSNPYTYGGAFPSYPAAGFGAGYALGNQYNNYNDQRDGLFGLSPEAGMTN